MIQTLILQALRRPIQTKPGSISQWSDVVLSYEEIPDFPAFESYRDELLPPVEPELFCCDTWAMNCQPP
ncbi:hypothetical protein [Leptolyngbya sp. FACHB-261]|uniref:hypothetical protein n=1 Tax=Leptolyngbya sp. FACHB-261 TaxID=2692806 RepID=UPI0018F0067B|nr:hypothetical protein [Leptolyngbya sp. FACHB-261]